MQVDNLKPGDLVSVFEGQACGGVPNGEIGLVLAQEVCQEFDQPKWTIMWASDNNEKIMRTNITYGYGIRVINEDR